jgi:SAM-dependent methyltransferase
MKVTKDLFGHLCKEYFDKGNSRELKLELDDGTIIDDFPISFYVDSKEFRAIELRYLRYANGKVLDLGCGSGRVGLFLKDHSGCSVLGVDNSSSLVHICKKRGLNAMLMDINQQLPKDSFETIVMYGNGFGIPGSMDNIRRLLHNLRDITSQDAVIIAESNDPNKMKNEIDLNYQKRNLALNRYVGQRRWRIMSGEEVSQYEDWMQLEPKLLRKLSQETGWIIEHGPEYETGSQWGAYFFVLRKTTKT